MKRLFALVALTVVLAACGSAATETEPAAGGPSEAVQVHGHWTIDILNADGTLDQHAEFENALTTVGSDLLVQSLAGTVGVREWIVFLGDLDNPLPGGLPGVAPCSSDKVNFTFGPPDPFALLTTGCVINDRFLSQPGLSDNLIVTAGPELRLEGSVVATQDGRIAFVETIAIEDVSQDPDFFGFTGTPTGPFDVLSGQTIEVSVDISFS